ncbi:MAG: hypothetical protein ACOC9S_00085 [Planctomycetota bacterium]
MAEPRETPQVRNKWLLVIAAVIALLVVVLYNVHVAGLQRSARGQQLTLLRTTADLKPGDRIERADLEAVSIRAENAEPFGNVLTEQDIQFAVRGSVNRELPAGRWLMWEHLLASGAPRPSEKIETGKVSCVVEIDSSPGDLLAVGDRVNILGVFSVDGDSPQTYRVVESVPVLAIEGRTAPGTRRTNYSKVQVIVDREVSPRLRNVLSHSRGGVWLEVLNPEAPVGESAGEINPELSSLARQSASGQRRRTIGNDGL